MHFAKLTEFIAFHGFYMNNEFQFLLSCLKYQTVNIFKMLKIAIIMIWTVVLFSESENVQIVNGKKTTIEKFPWTASVNAAIHWIPLEADLKCTAVIIGKKWILSAAHCNDHPWFHYYFIRAGSNAPTWAVRIQH